MQSFLNQILNTSLFKICDKKAGVMPLTDKQEVKAKIFIQKLIEHNEKGLLTLCLRGENYKNLSLKLFPYDDRGSNKFSSEFYRRCFMLGDKSKTNYLCNYNYNNPIPWSMDIGRVHETDFDLIFYEMSYLVSNFNTYWNFGNKEVIEYFSNNDNKTHWKDILNSLTVEQQLLIRDYYCWLLHTAANHRFERNTYYVSTTLDSEMCENYAYGNDTDGGPVAIIYFVPNPIYKYATNFESLFRANYLLKYYSLPVINAEMYPDEFEISIKGGLFPHFIIGIYEYKDNRFVCNHHFFKKKNRNINNILKSGINIDQLSFYQYLIKTNYHSGVGILSDGQFMRIKT